MSTGRPVIASRIGGLQDVVEHGRSGLLVPPGDPAALCQAMQQLLDQPTLRRQLGQGARARATQYEAGVVIPQVEAVYAELRSEGELSIVNCQLSIVNDRQDTQHATRNTQTRNTQTRNTQTRNTQHANTQTRKHANTQTRKHANTQHATKETLLANG
jgi:hypothetical protein